MLITIGDSWTWGDSLKDLSFDYRSKHVYGKYISEYFDADWINWGRCGGGNNIMVSVLEEFLLTIFDDYIPYISKEKFDQIKGMTWKTYEDFLKFDLDFSHKQEIKSISSKRYSIEDHYKQQLLKTTYENIYVVITATESGRDFWTLLSDDHEFFPAKNLLTTKEVLQFDEQKFYNKINYIKHYLEKFKKAKLLTARNFSKDFKTTKNESIVTKSWIEINFEKNHQNNHKNCNYDVKDILCTGPVSGIGIKSINNRISCDDKKLYITKQIESADKLWHWLRNNPLNYNIATCHPTEESHKLWANYLIQHFE